MRGGVLVYTAWGTIGPIMDAQTKEKRVVHHLCGYTPGVFFSLSRASSAGDDVGGSRYRKTVFIYTSIEEKENTLKSKFTSVGKLALQIRTSAIRQIFSDTNSLRYAFKLSREGGGSETDFDRTVHFGIIRCSLKRKVRIYGQR